MSFSKEQSQVGQNLSLICQQVYLIDFQASSYSWAGYRNSMERTVSYQSSWPILEQQRNFFPFLKIYFLSKLKSSNDILVATIFSKCHFSNSTKFEDNKV